MRSFWSRSLLAALLVLITFLFPFLAPTPHRIDRAHADLIVQGMTKEQVEAIFGVPVGQYDWAEENGRGVYLRAFLGQITSTRLIDSTGKGDGGNAVVLGALLAIREPPQTSLTWTSRHGSFTIWFDENEHVVSSDAWTDVRIVPPWQRWWTRLWKK